LVTNKNPSPARAQPRIIISNELCSQFSLLLRPFRAWDLN
jgi:hypothetical protein